MYYEKRFNIFRGEHTFAEAATKAGLAFTTVAAMLLISAMLIYSCGRGTKAVYTLARLNISFKKVFLTAMLYFTCIYLVFWFVQAFVLFMLSRYYIVNAPYEIETPSVFLSFATSRYLLAFIPVRGALLYITNIAKVIFASTVTATSHFDVIRGKGKGSGGNTSSHKDNL